ncbi:phosphoserine phosphatase SerB [Candidatus Altiarchaeota archaeon]
MKKDLLAVSILGLDRPGLLSDITGAISELNVNIVDITQTTPHHILSLFLLLDPNTSEENVDVIRGTILEKAGELNLRAVVSSLKELGKHIPPQKEDLQTITVVGRDKPGIIHAITKVIGEQGINIERINQISRGEFFVMELLTGRVEPVDLKELRAFLQKKGEEIEVDVIVQQEDLFRRRKHIIVFDMDSTIVDAEVIDELANLVGVGGPVAEITAAGMRGEIDFEEGLRKRVKMLKGTPVSVLEELAGALKLTPGTEELVLTLKEMGFKTGLVSGGFTFFTDKLKEKLGFDYAYANQVEINDGILTGEVIGQIVDRERKGEIVSEICKIEGVSSDSCVAVGDGANDDVMLKNAGLGIAFNAKEILKKKADGAIDHSNILTLLYCLGMRRSNDS